MTGRFFDRCHVAPDVPDRALAQAFWDACEDMTGEHWSGAQRSSIRSQRVAG
ncbi:MAG: hypothetical protein HY048_12670 [Acidobacteria bacterium]|nr:hypothetical protein [Acidobacteriota bacterium]